LHLKSNGDSVPRNHEIRVGLLPVGGESRKVVAAAYHDGSVIFGRGASHMEHPETRISISGQNTILWIARFPFMVLLEGASPDALPDDLFHRMPKWRSIRGKDGLHRVQTGALNTKYSVILKGEFEYKYSIFKRADENSDEPDRDTEALDPHIIVEP
jgi:hypothetical protein